MRFTSIFLPTLALLSTAITCAPINPLATTELLTTLNTLSSSPPRLGIRNTPPSSDSSSFTLIDDDDGKDEDEDEDKAAAKPKGGVFTKIGNWFSGIFKKKKKDDKPIELANMPSAPHPGNRLSVGSEVHPGNRVPTPHGDHMLR